MLHFEFRQDRLAEAHALKSFELGQGAIEVAFEARFLAAQEIRAGPFEGNVRRRELLPGLGPNPQDQAGLFVLLKEPSDDRDCSPQKTLDLGTRAVRCTEPDDFWWVAAQHASFLKVRILRNNRVTIVFGILPNRRIVHATQPAVMNMCRTWIDIHQRSNQARREVFVEEKLHALEISNLRSRSAA